MIVITADQIASRTTSDMVANTVDALNSSFDGKLPHRAERTVGDEIQLMVDSGATALHVIRDLSRVGRWSIGVGLGDVRMPLGASIRESNGPAFFAARDAVERAKKRATHFAVSHNPESPLAGEIEALIDLLLLLREERTGKAWRLYDLLAEGMTQGEAAKKLGVSAQATSKMSIAWSFRAEEAGTRAAAAQLDRINL